MKIPFQIARTAWGRLRRRTRRRLTVLAILFAVFAAFLVEERVRGHLELAAWQRAMRARGEMLTLAELTASLSPTNARILTPDQVIAMLPFNARSDLPTFPADKPHGTDVELWRQPAWNAAGDKTNDWAALARDFAETRAQLAAFRVTLTSQVYAVKLDYAQGFTLFLPHLARYKATAQNFRLATLLALHDGRLDEAFENLAAEPAFVEFCGTEALVINELVRIAVASIALETLWQALQADGWTEAQLAALQHAWARIDFLPRMARALEIERAMTAGYFTGEGGRLRELMEAYGPVSEFIAGSSPPSGAYELEALRPVIEVGARVRGFAMFQVWRVAWRDQALLHHNRVVQGWVAEGREAHRQRNARSIISQEAKSRAAWFEPALMSEPAFEGWYNRARYWLSGLSLPSLERSLARVATAEVQRELAVTAIALKRYRLKHGRWPEKLQALTPEFCAEPPHDWMDGQPLRYRLNADGSFTLYSVGADGRDDDGDARPEQPGLRGWQRGRDLVWPRPATEEEIQTALEQGPRSRMRGVRLLPAGVSN